MNPSVFILEDNPAFAEALIKMIENYPIRIDYTYAANLNTALRKIDEAVHYTAFFIDIALDDNIENTDGLSFAKFLSEKPAYKDTPVIFTTSFPDYVYEALNHLHCYAYLLKPFDRDDVFHQLDQILRTNDSIRFKTADGIYMKLDTDEIYYIQAFGRNMHFMTKHGEITSRQYTMKSLNDILPGSFERCHKSFLVNKKYIQSVNPRTKTLHLRGLDDDIPYGKDFHIE